MSIIARHGQVLRNERNGTDYFHTAGVLARVCMRVSARIRIPNFLKQLCHNTRAPPFRISLPTQSVLPPYHDVRFSHAGRSPAGYHVVTRPRIEFHANDYKVPAICGCTRTRRPRTGSAAFTLLLLREENA